MGDGLNSIKAFKAGKGRFVASCGIGIHGILVSWIMQQVRHRCPKACNISWLGIVGGSLSPFVMCYV